MNAENNQTNEFITCDCEKIYMETRFHIQLTNFFKSPFQ